MDLSFEPLTPLSMLERAGAVHGDRIGVIDEGRSTTYAELRDRAQRLAGALRAMGISHGDSVAVLAPNTQLLLEAHFGVPWTGGWVLPLNIRLKPREFAYILDHAQASILLSDAALVDTAREALALAERDIQLVTDGPDGGYEAMLADASPLTEPVTDERSLIAVNYTSGTTGRPKGVMYHHRGAYLQALAMAVHMRLGADSVYLWTLPMFHCNGWCFPYAVTAVGGTHLCLHKVDPEQIWKLIQEHGVTHFHAAPTVLSSLAYHPLADEVTIERPISVGTGGSPPSPALLARLAELRIDVTHLYGLTETFGPSVICEWHPEWNQNPLPEQARLKARQGVANVIGVPLRVVDDDGRDVPADGASMGEIALRGNNVMAGYLHDPEATAEAAPDGWFRSGDLAVMHPDGYVEVRDREKDVIISGGENIASIEVEQALESHPAVIEAAVVALPHDKWGEVPTAFVTCKEGLEVTEEELVQHVRAQLAHFKAPKHVIFSDLPKTSTGKVQKFVLRERARELLSEA